MSGHQRRAILTWDDRRGVFLGLSGAGMTSRLRQGATVYQLGEGLPAQFFAGLARVSDQVAACVLIAPDRAPSRRELPREWITTAGLSAVLRASILNHRAPEAMPAAVIAEMGRRDGVRYLSRLLWMLQLNTRGEIALVYRLPWYVHRLRRMLVELREYEQAIIGLSDRLQAGWSLSEEI